MRTPREFAKAVLDTVTAAIESGAVGSLEASLNTLVAEQDPGPVELGIITKVDEDQHMVWGWGSVVTKGGEPVVDRQGDIIDVDELQKAVHEALADGSLPLGNMHQRIGVGGIRDSIVFTRDVQKALGIDLGCEGWFVGAKVDDPKTWRQIKAGELGAFSIGGTGHREDVTKGGGPTKDGLPASSFAYVGDRNDPSTWKLPYKHADGSVDSKHLAGAMAALSSGGFRGNRVSLPAGAVAGVKAKLRGAHRANGGKPSELPAHMLSKCGDTMSYKDDDDEKPCPSCGGTGKRGDKDCPTCDGSGMVPDDE